MFIAALAAGMPLLLWRLCAPSPASAFKGKGAAAVACLSALPFMSAIFGLTGLMLEASPREATASGVLIAGCASAAALAPIAAVLRWLLRADTPNEAAGMWPPAPEDMAEPVHLASVH